IVSLSVWQFVPFAILDLHPHESIYSVRLLRAPLSHEQHLFSGLSQVSFSVLDSLLLQLLLLVFLTPLVQRCLTHAESLRGFPFFHLIVYTREVALVYLKYHSKQYQSPLSLHRHGPRPDPLLYASGGSSQGLDRASLE